MPLAHAHARQACQRSSYGAAYVGEEDQLETHKREEVQLEQRAAERSVRARYPPLVLQIIVHRRLRLDGHHELGAVAVVVRGRVIVADDHERAAVEQDGEPARREAPQEQGALVAWGRDVEGGDRETHNIHICSQGALAANA